MQTQNPKTPKPQTPKTPKPHNPKTPNPQNPNLIHLTIDDEGPDMRLHDVLHSSPSTDKTSHGILYHGILCLGNPDCVFMLVLKSGSSPARGHLVCHLFSCVDRLSLLFSSRWECVAVSVREDRCGSVRSILILWNLLAAFLFRVLDPFQVLHFLQMRWSFLVKEDPRDQGLEDMLVFTAPLVR